MSVEDFFHNRVSIVLKSGHKFNGLLSLISYEESRIVLEDVAFTGSQLDPRFMPNEKKIPKKEFEKDQIKSIDFRYKSFKLTQPTSFYNREADFFDGSLKDDADYVTRNQEGSRQNNRRNDNNGPRDDYRRRENDNYRPVYRQRDNNNQRTDNRRQNNEGPNYRRPEGEYQRPDYRRQDNERPKDYRPKESYKDNDPQRDNDSRRNR